MGISMRGFRKCSRILRNEEGAALVELAFLAPLFIIIYISVLYFADLIIAQSRVANAADSLAKTAASFDVCLKDDPARLEALFNATKALLPENELRGMVLTSIAPEKDGNGKETGAWKVEWSRADPGSPNVSESSYSSFGSEQGAAFSDALQWKKPLMIATVTTEHAPSSAILGDMIAQDITRQSIIPAFSAAAACPKLP